MDGSNQIYACELGRLARELMAATPALIRRLECLYDEILIDEVQDLSGYDWEIVLELLKSRIDVRMVGDVRQAVLSTNPRGRKINSMGMQVHLNGSLYAKSEGCFALTTGVGAVVESSRALMRVMISWQSQSSFSSGPLGYR